MDKLSLTDIRKLLTKLERDTEQARRVKDRSMKWPLREADRKYGINMRGESVDHAEYRRIVWDRCLPLARAQHTRPAVDC